MRTVFADTYYFLALWNPLDQGHAKALEFTRSHRVGLLATDWVITEVADGMAHPPNRKRFSRFFRSLQQQEEFVVVPASRKLLDQGLDLYERRPDKEWSLTDCISFVVMQENEIVEALTEDHHFEQAGFVALLK
jgi:predicted nucleic acid-binding protein